MLGAYNEEVDNWYRQTMRLKFFKNVKVLPFGNNEIETYKKYGFGGLLDENIYDNPDLFASNDIVDNMDWLINNNDNNNDISVSNSNDNSMNIKSNYGNNNNNDSNNDNSSGNSNDNSMNIKSNYGNNKNDKKEIDSDIESNASNGNNMNDHSNKSDIDSDEKKTHFPRCNTRSRRKMGLTQAELDGLCKDIEEKTKLREMRQQKKKEKRMKQKELKKKIDKFNLEDFNFYCGDDDDDDSVKMDSEGTYFVYNLTNFQCIIRFMF